MLLNKDSITSFSLDAAGLVALADLSTISERTALAGSASILDILLLAPGIHTEQRAADINGGELPATGAMTSGYVFRIENQATVRYLQSFGEPGYLVTVKVESERVPHMRDLLSPANLLYGIGLALSCAVIAVLGSIHDYWAVAVLLMLMVARLLNTIIIKRRTQIGWKGSKEPGEQGDLLVLLSNDRWVRIQGLVDDLKAVTSGQWLRDQTTLEKFGSSIATLLVYVAAALNTNASTIGSLFIAVLLLISVALLALCNSLTKELRMFGRSVFTSGRPRKYERRLDMARELVEESGRSDWAISMGLIIPDGPPSRVQL